MPKVSIILPSYNGAEYLAQAIESILSQTFPDWELILVDDCSADATLSIANAYAARDPRIRVVHNKSNQKLPASLNIGMHQARGDYLTWTSDDNLYLPEALEEMVRFLDQSPDSDLVSADDRIIDADGRVISERRQFSPELLACFNCLGACFLYRRKILRTVGDYAPAWFLVEDYDYWLRILLHGHGIGRIHRVLYSYRQHSASLSSTRTREIQDREALLLLHYAQQIVQEFPGNVQVLSTLYMKTMELDLSPAQQSLQAQIRSFCPLLCNLSLYSGTDDVYVYGAGTYGRIASRQFSPHIIAYIDRAPDKIGSMLNHKQVFSPEILSRISPTRSILVALSAESVYSAIQSLPGHLHYCIMPRKFLS